MTDPTRELLPIPITELILLVANANLRRGGNFPVFILSRTSDLSCHDIGSPHRFCLPVPPPIYGQSISECPVREPLVPCATQHDRISTSFLAVCSHRLRFNPPTCIFLPSGRDNLVLSCVRSLTNRPAYCWSSEKRIYSSHRFLLAWSPSCRHFMLRSVG